MLGGVYLLANRFPEATRELEMAAKLDSASMQTLGLLAYSYAKTGNGKRAGEIVRMLESNVGRRSGASAAAARVYIALGDNAKALSLLERAANDHDSFFSSESLAENFFDSIRGDARFAAIVAKAGLDKRLLAKQ